MIKKKQVLGYLLILLMTYNYACAPLQHRHDYKLEVVSYSTYIMVEGTPKKIKYFMNVPKNHQFTRIIGSHEEEFNFIYSDSSIIYITDDWETGSPLNHTNAQSSNKNYTDKLVQDCVFWSGQQLNGKYWAEYKLKHLTVGYVNVPEDKKELYENAINSLRKNRKNKIGVVITK